MKTVLLTVLFSLALVNSPMSQALLDKRSDASLLINITNFTKFYEFQFNMSAAEPEKLREGKVEKVAQADRIKYEWCSPAFHEKHISKDVKKRSVMKQYESVFSFDQNGVAEISTDGKYIAYNGCCNDKSILHVANMQGTKRLFSIRPSMGNRIDDAQWLNNSIVIISRRSRLGYWPWELLVALAGHPVSYDTFYLECYSLEGKLIRSTNIIKDITDANGFMVKN